MKEKEMLRIAELIKRAIVDKEDSEKIRAETAKLCSEFQGMEYCFDK
jgi:glycine/serine hydroxymethyltransferase